MATDREIFEQKIKRAYEILSQVSSDAYADFFMLSNQVLSKSPWTNNFLNNYLFQRSPARHSIFEMIIKITRYYFYSMAAFFLYVIAFIVHAAGNTRFKPSDRDNELIVIDAFFLTDEILQTKRFQDKYFPGLETTLRKLKKNYVYLPVFYTLRNPINLYPLLRILKKDNVPVLSEYQLLSLADIAYILYFIVVYPWRVIRFSKRLKKKNGYETELIRSEILDTIGSVTFHSFSRYLQGKKISGLPYKKIKVISWYENQVVHKNLYKGLRSNKHKVTLYGSQLFLYADTDLNIIPDENGLIHDVVPDTIVVNGPAFVPPTTRLSYRVGPSLRYLNLFNSIMSKNDRDHILALLPYDDDLTTNIMSIIAASELFNKNLLIKFHPASQISKFKYILSPRFKIVNDNIYSLFRISKIVIGCASGSLIEATSLGIPVIVVNDPKRFQNNILPEYGRGIIWDEANNADELMTLVNKYEKAIEDNREEIAIVAGNYKKMFFCEPTEEKIIEAFDL